MAIFGRRYPMQRAVLVQSVPSSANTVTDADTGTGTDTASVVASIPATDASGAGVDATSPITANVSASDAATGTESAAVLVGTTVDSGHGTESAAATVSVVATDVSGAGVDAASLVASIPAPDTASGAEATSITATVPATSTGSGADTAGVLLSSAADTGTGTDAATATVSAAGTDSASGTDVGSVSPTIIAADASGVSASAQSIKVKPDGLAVSDSFNRADSSSMGTANTGQTWVNGLSTWGIATNQASPNALGNASTFIDAGTADVHAKVTFAAIGTAGYSFLLFRYQDDNNRLLFGSFGVGQVYQYMESAGGTTTRTVNGSSLMAAAGDVVEVVAVGTGINCYVNGNLEVSVTSTVFQTLTKVGLQTNKNATSYDDFSVSSPQLPSDSATGTELAGIRIAASDTGSGIGSAGVLVVVGDTATGVENFSIAIQGAIFGPRVLNIDPEVRMKANSFDNRTSSVDSEARMKVIANA